MHATIAISRMQQQQYHTCNNSHITHATTASNTHATTASITHATTASITHATTAISHIQQQQVSRMQQQQVSRMQQQQYHACNNSNITHATTAISRMQQQQYHACNNSNFTRATTANITKSLRLNLNIHFKVLALNAHDQESLHVISHRYAQIPPKIPL